MRAGFSAILLLVAGMLDAAPLRVLAIGDSLTEEYRFETPFSGPNTTPPPIDANTHNWPEIISSRRPDDLSFGTYEANLVSYPDFRDGGYKYNYGIPGFTAEAWVEIINTTFLDSFNGAYEALCYSTKTSLTRMLQDENIGVVVIFLGGNDLNSKYDEVFEDPVAPAWLQGIVTNIRAIRNFVRSKNTTVPIVICTMPDIGATPKVAGDYPVPAGKALARQRIAAANGSIIAMAAEVGSQVARIDLLTDRIFDEQPFQINGTVFLYPPDDQNPPDRLFCHDGFHPATAAQAIITNTVVDAINRATGRTIPLLTNREILGDVVGLNPDQPYLTWAGSAGGMTADPDGDGIRNLVEYVLGTPALTTSSPYVFAANGRLSFPVSPEGLRFADLAVEESVNLSAWTPLPAGRLSVAGDGTWRVEPGATGKTFYRLRATTKP